MSSTPIIKVTLAHASGAVSGYMPGTNNNAELHGGLREAIVTCFSRFGDAALFQRVELLRADIAGANWAAMDRAGAFQEMHDRIAKAAHDLAGGHEPHVVVTLTEGRGMSDAYMVTNREELSAALKDSSKRSLAVPRILPFQLGGDETGATAVIYSPAAGGGLRLHSIHPTQSEARIAESDLKSKGETKTGQMQVHSTVTKLLALVASGNYKPPAPGEQMAEPSPGESAPSLTATPVYQHPGLKPTLPVKPSPFESY